MPIKEELDKIKSRISAPDFLANKGLSNEVGIHVFCYDPKDELAVRDYIERLRGDTSGAFRVIECDLYGIFLSILEGKRVLDKVAAMEERKGKDYLLKQLQKNATPDDFLAKMDYFPKERGKDVLFMTGIGKVYPFMRTHILLEKIQSAFADIPIVVFYPGGYNGQGLTLFGKFKDGNYYRAFNLL